jgi:hypothetical protein
MPIFANERLNASVTRIKAAVAAQEQAADNELTTNEALVVFLVMIRRLHKEHGLDTSGRAVVLKIVEDTIREMA